jgi:TRAP-type C4-dicarboxylate transport system substrate-binding protein
MKKTMKIATWSALAVTLAALMGAQAPQAAAQQVTLRLHNFNSPKAIANRLFMRPWAKALENKTNGRLKVEIYPAMQLGGRPGDLYGQARDGVVDMVWTLPGYSPGRFPLTEVFELPYVGADATATSQAMNEFFGKWLTDEYKDSHPLVFHTTAAGHIHTVKKAIRRLEDLKGMKIRGHSRINAGVLRALGAVPVGMPVPKVYEAISRGVVEGTWIPWTIMRPFRLHEVTNFHTELSISPALFLLTMNKSSHAKLPADLRHAIDASTGMALAKRLGKMWQDDEKPGRAIAVKKGHAIIALDAAETERWKAAVRPVIEGWIKKVSAKGHDGRAMVADARRLVAKYSR